MENRTQAKARQLSDVQIAEIKKAFQMVDQDGNGQIDASEVRARMISHDLPRCLLYFSHSLQLNFFNFFIFNYYYKISVVSFTRISHRFPPAEWFCSTASDTEH